jgi:hypothetical protein
MSCVVYPSVHTIRKGPGLVLTHLKRLLTYDILRYFSEAFDTEAAGQFLEPLNATLGQPQAAKTMGTDHCPGHRIVTLRFELIDGLN